MVIISGQLVDKMNSQRPTASIIYIHQFKNRCYRTRLSKINGSRFTETNNLMTKNHILVLKVSSNYWNLKILV